MTNLTIDFEGDTLVLRCDLSQEHGFTKSGASIKVGASDGNLTLWRDGQPTPFVVNANIYRKPTPEEKAEGRRQGCRIF